MKATYESPVMDIYAFDAANVISTSGDDERAKANGLPFEGVDENGTIG